MQKVLINISADISSIQSYYLDSYEDIIEKHSLEVINYYKINSEKNQIPNKKGLKNKGIHAIGYIDEKDLRKQVKKMNKKYEIVFINTFSEKLIILTNQLREAIDQKNTIRYKLFRNKKIQRQLLKKEDISITINYIKAKFGNLDIEKIEKKIGYPFIMKPRNGIESFNVYKVSSRKDYERIVKNNKFEDETKVIIEEFITGDLYSVDYFVDQQGEIHMNKCINTLQANHIGVDDFFHYNASFKKEGGNKISDSDLKKFVKKTVKATGIKNTFVHHEFKLNDEKVCKTIELNGRIGGYRLELYQQALGINLLEMPIIKKCNIKNKINYNFGVFSIYPIQKGILKNYNHELIKKIKNLDSYYKIRINPRKYEGAKIGLTKHGFGKVGTIKIKHSDSEIFQKDYDFIEQTYKDLLILE